MVPTVCTVVYALGLLVFMATNRVQVHFGELYLAPRGGSKRVSEVSIETTSQITTCF